MTGDFLCLCFPDFGYNEEDLTITFEIMATDMDVEAFKKAGFTFEEIQRAGESMEDFTKT